MSSISGANPTSPTPTASPSQPSAAEALVDAARACLNTPFRHQGRDPQRGLDCLGLVIVSAKAAGLLDKSYDRTGYARRPNADEMSAELDARLDRTARDGHGVLARFSVGGEAIHLGILTRDGTVIHANVMARKVVEHRLDAHLRSTIVQRYTFRETP